MALDNAALLEVLEAMQAGGVEDRVRTAAQTIYKALIDAELTSVIGAGLWERSADRTAQRNGSRPRTLTTTAGDLELRIPRLRVGSFFPSLLERRRRADQALPRMGRLNLAQVVPEGGPILGRSESAEQVAAEAGVAPVTCASGHRRSVAFRVSRRRRGASRGRKGSGAPTLPDDANPATGEDADGVRMTAPAVPGLGIDARGPGSAWRLLSGIR
jgi:hypothetical protein